MRTSGLMSGKRSRVKLQFLRFTALSLPFQRCQQQQPRRSSQDGHGDVPACRGDWRQPRQVKADEVFSFISALTGR
jgi:hypothetical protein